MTNSATHLDISSKTLLAFFALVGCVALGCQRGDPLGPVADVNEVDRLRTSFASESTGSSAAAGPVGTGWATLKGKFVFDGTPPQMEPYNVNKDRAACTSGGKAPLQETIIVDESSGGLANVAIYLRTASRVHESAQEPTDPTAVFDQKECVFLTHVFPITLGQKMAIKNSDPVGHNTNIGGKNGFNQTIPAGQTIDFNPQKEEAIPVAVRCSIHPWMIAYMLPRKNGYYAVSGQDGSFEIPNLPAGEVLEIQVWHESGTGPNGALVLSTDEAKELKWSKKGRFKLKLTEGETKELAISVPGSALGT